MLLPIRASDLARASSPFAIAVSRAATQSGATHACSSSGDSAGGRSDAVRPSKALDVKHSPTEIMGSTLLIGEKKIPFSIQSAERISGVPEDGVGVLLPIGTSHPTLRLIGEPSFLHPIAAAPAGTTVTLIGNLNTADSYIELMGVDLPPSAGAQ